MELLRGNLYVYIESSPHNGKWILSSILLFSDGKLEVNIQNEKNTFHMSSNCTVQAPMDTVWHRIPPLPFRRAAKETFRLNPKNSSAFWFLASSCEERDQWYAALSQFTNRKPPPYGDYDNWTYPHLNSETDSKSHHFHPRRSLTPSHRSGFYSVQENQRRSLQPFKTPADVHHSGFYTTQEHRKSARFPDRLSSHGRYGCYEPNNQKLTDEPKSNVIPVALNTGNEQEKDTGLSNRKGCCTWCCIAFACLCNIFSTCLHQCCMNCAVPV